MLGLLGMDKRDTRETTVMQHVIPHGCFSVMHGVGYGVVCYVV